MTTESTSTTQPPAHKPAPIAQVTANEWGQITGLEAHATYFVVRKPTPEYTREQSKRMMEDVRAFLHEQRVLAERQMKELNDKYGEPAKGRVGEIRATLEKKFDEIAKEIEARVEKIEHDLNERGILKPRNGDAPAHAPAGETPGEMPTGHHDEANSAKPASSKKKPSGTKME